MKKIIAVCLALATLFMVSPALTESASANQITSYTQLNNDNWTPLPNATDRYCWRGSGCDVFFKWLNPLPGKATTIRVVNCAGNELSRRRIEGMPANYTPPSYLISYTLAWGSCFRVQGRNPTEVGDMANIHWYEIIW